MVPLASVIFAASLSALLGLAFCFLGYRVFLVMLPIWGFFAGFWLGAEAVALLLGTGFLATVTGWVAGAALGLVGAVLSYVFYLAGVAIVAAGVGAALGAGLMSAIGFETGLLTTLAWLAGGLVAAGLTLWYNVQKYVIIVITAAAGANLLVLSPLLLFGRISLEELTLAGSSVGLVFQESWLWVVVWVILAVAGVVVQLRANREYVFTPDRYVEGWG